MTCVICKHGQTHPGHATVTLHRGPSTIIFKNVPADVCDNCGEYYLTEQITADLMTRAGDAVAKGAEVEILRYAA